MAPSDDAEKPLRKCLSKKETFFMLLMPISQSVAWMLVLVGADDDLMPSITKVSTFYMLWAIFNKLTQKKSKELGFISMGLLALASSMFSESQVPSICGTLLVLVNFFLPFYSIIGRWSAHKLARTLNKTLIWAYVFKVYFVSNLFFWTTVLYKLAKMM